MSIKQTCGLHQGCDNDQGDNGESEGLELPRESGMWNALCSHTADLPTTLKTPPGPHPSNAEFLPIQREQAQHTQTGSFTFSSQMEAERQTLSFTFSRLLQQFQDNHPPKRLPASRSWPKGRAAACAHSGSGRRQGSFRMPGLLGDG